MRKLRALALVAVAAVATNAWAIGEARLNGKVVDADGKPIQGVTVTVTALEGKNVKQSSTTNKNGDYAIFLVEGRFPFKLTVAKEGLATYEETIKLKLAPERNVKNITLQSAAAVAAASADVAAPTGNDKAAIAYNEGAELANAGKTAEAIAKFEEAVSLNAELTAGYIALTKLYARENNWAKVVDRGNKALEVVSDDADILALVAQGHEKLGDKQKAAEYRSKAPKDANALFNEAARLINANKQAEAEPLLKQAIEANGEFAQAYFQLGMVQAALSKNAEAKANLSRYLELEPNGKDAATAKEMMSYIK